MDRLLIGIDEAGMGTLAGPMTAAVVIIAEDRVPKGVRDSKTLNEDQREELAGQIMEKALAYKMVDRSADLIDTKGLSFCWKDAMKELARVGMLFHKQAAEMVVDGNRFIPGFRQVIPIVKADVTHPAVSAASILAKYLQCGWMDDFDLMYPKYGFRSHHGYGTAEHLRILKELGPCLIHRRSFKPVKILLGHA
jgi:ribonuclease HII